MEVSIEKNKEVLLQTLKAFNVFCEKHNIQYFAAYGTLIGAIRHKGFIPWDDDIDVYMTRKEYDRFLSYRSELCDADYRICDHQDEGCPTSFARFYYANMSFWEYKQFPFIIGTFIDVIPLEEVEGNTPMVMSARQSIHHIRWKYRKSIACHPLKEIVSDLKSFDILSVAIKIYKKVRYRPFKNKYYRQLLQKEQEIRAMKGNYYKPFVFSIKSLYEKSWFENSLDWPFEDTTIKVPVGYEELLKYVYGDYMKLPPEEQRFGHHFSYYLDWNKRKSVAEILSEADAIVHPRKPLSLRSVIDEIKHKKGFSY